MAFEALNASLSASDGISGTLQDLKDAAQGAAGGAIEASQSFGSFGSTLDQTDDDAIETTVGVREVADAIESVGDTAVENVPNVQTLRGAIADLDRVDVDDVRANVDIEGVETARTELEALDGVDVSPSGEVDLQGLQTVLARLDALDDREVSPEVEVDGETDRVAELRTRLAALDGVEVDADARVDVEGLSAARAALAGLDDSEVDLVNVSLDDSVAGTIGDLGDRASDSDGDVGGLRDSLGSLAGFDLSGLRSSLSGLGDAASTGDLDADLETVPNAALAASESIDELELRIGESRRTAATFASALNNLSGEERDAAATAIEASDTLGELRLRLRSAGGEARQAASQIDDLDGAAADLVDQSLASASGVRTLRGSIDEVGDEAAQAARQIDDLGDESVASAAQTNTLRGAADDAGDSLGGFTASVGGISGRLSRLGPIVAGIAPAILGLGSAFGGAAAGAGAFGGALGGIVFGGLQNKAQELADSNESIANASEGLEQIFSAFGDAVKEALAPLQTAANTEFAVAGLDGVVTLAEMAAESIASVAPVVRDVASSLGSDLLETAPAIFDQLETSVRAIAPAIEGLGGLIRGLPTAIAFLRSEAAQIGPQLVSFAGSLFRLSVAAADLGSDLLAILLPPLTILVDVLGLIAGVAAAVPQPLKIAAIAAVTAAAAYSVYAASAGIATIATSALATVIGILTSPITAVVAAIGLVVGALAFVIDRFNLWNDIIGVFVGIWNGFLGIVQSGINIILGLYDALGFLGPVLFPGIAVLRNLGEIVDFVMGALDTLAATAQDIFSEIARILNEVIRLTNGAIEAADAVAESVGLDLRAESDGSGVDLSGLEAARPSEDSGGDSGEGEGDSGDGGESESDGDSDDDESFLDGLDPREGREASRRAEQSATTEQRYDFSGADFSGKDSSEVERTVREAIRKANRETRAREDGTGG